MLADIMAESTTTCPPQEDKIKGQALQPFQVDPALKIDGVWIYVQ